MTTTVSGTDLLAALDALPQRLAARRGELGLSVRAAAAEIGCSFSAVSRFEARECDPQLAMIKAVIRWLETRP